MITSITYKEVTLEDITVHEVGITYKDVYVPLKQLKYKFTARAFQWFVAKIMGI